MTPVDEEASGGGLVLPAHGGALRRQLMGTALLGLALLAGIALSHALFAPLLGFPSEAFLLAVAVRFLVQVGEVLALQRGWPRSRRRLGAYVHVSIAGNLAFAFLLSRLSGIADSHYVVLMLVPVIAAGFLYRASFVAAVVGAAGALTFAEVWLSSGSSRPVSPQDLLEAATVVMLYAAVAIVVALLARALSEEHAALRRHAEELARTRAELVREEKLAALGRLSAAIAHEIRNPVAMIASALAVEEEGGPQALSPGELRQIVRSETSRLERLAGDFLSYARQRPPEPRQVTLEDTLAAVADLAQAFASREGVVLEREPTKNVEARLDPYLVHQALLNLVTNAIDATPPGGSVRLSARSSGDGVAFAVENSGPAVGTASVERIFEPFFSTKEGGTGLGLPIARSIARAHGGELALRSNCDGAVRFELILPAICADVKEVPVGAHSDR